MSYLVLARKWRPQTFVDLVGQEHVAHTLKNAIAQGRIAHAFLFTGARGVGKTTIARVMAKALNCMTASGPTAEPCGKCAACEEIARSNDVDVKEIDGASNNSVEDVRKLQESLPYLPVRDRYKVVIIDEVHMLSTGAFNALLKTLEEPPPHVKFIFATTEVHKVPITILSRCQRYDFKLIPTQKIRDRLAYIMKQEGIAHDDAAVALVSREAAGSMRDALSLLDQVIAGVDGKLTGVEAGRLLGVANRSVMYEMARAVLGGDAARALEIVQSLATEGYDIATVSRQFLSVLRDLVVARVLEEPGDLLDLADEERGDVLQIARAHDRADLERLFVAWSRTSEEIAKAREQRWVMEMALVRLAHRPPLVPIDDLLARLADLERRVAGGGEPHPKGPSGSGGGGPGAGAGGSGAGTGTRGAPARPASSASSASSPVRMVAGASANDASAGAPMARSEHGGADVSRSQSVARASEPGASSSGTGALALAPAVSQATAAAATPGWLNRGLSRPGPETPSGGVATPSRTSAVPPAPRNGGPMASSPTRSVQPPVPVEVIDTRAAAGLLDRWAQILEHVESGPVAVLKHAVPLVISVEQIRIGFEPGSFYARKLASIESQEAIAIAAERALGSRPVVEIVQGTLGDDAPTIARREDAHRASVRAQREATAREHPLVRRFLQLVGGEVKSVKLED